MRVPLQGDFSDERYCALLLTRVLFTHRQRKQGNEMATKGTYAKLTEGPYAGRTVWVCNVSKDGATATVMLRKVVGYAGSHSAHPVYGYSAKQKVRTEILA